MKTNDIMLEFPEILSRISGNDYGLNIYETQIEPHLKEGVKNKIIFPDEITGISISFVQGLMGKELNKYGKEKIFDHFCFYSVHDEVVKSVEESINY